VFFTAACFVEVCMTHRVLETSPFCALADKDPHTLWSDSDAFLAAHEVCESVFWFEFSFRMDHGMRLCTSLSNLNHLQLNDITNCDPFLQQREMVQFIAILSVPTFILTII
jgi:hypothetical protein